MWPAPDDEAPEHLGASGVALECFGGTSDPIGRPRYNLSAGLVTRFRSRTERRINLFSRRTLYVLVVACFALAAASPAVAGKGGGKGANASAALCSVADNTVHADGLPTDQVVNFMVTDSSGTSGWVLGFTDDGSWSVPVASPNGPTTYEFVSRTWGPGGSHYTTFASCSA